MAIDRPYGITLPPKRSLSVEEAELDQEKAELQDIELKAARARERARDPIGDLLGSALCKRNYGFWFIKYRGFPIYVTHFYQDKNVAVDVFQVIGREEKREIEFKRNALKSEGIRYGALDYYMDVAELLPQISKVNLWPFSRK